jgi:hypothetical protein
MSETLERRARAIRARAAIRSWEFRQRAHAKGVWYRLRRVLAEAKTVSVLPREEAELLLAEGLRPEAVGAELEPPKMLLWVTDERLARISDRRDIPVRLGPELLEARYLALTRFE